MRFRILICCAVLLVGPGVLEAKGIAWHEGDVQSAFDLARDEGKPLFLYWGAVWCPPCNQIKKTIFTQREFIDKTRLFVPVYLDGDTESAQIWSEKLDVAGYPTMLVMSSEGREVMRLPTGLQIDDFVRVLDDALERTAPLAEVLESTLAAANPRDVPERSYRLLAYHSWGQDRRLELSNVEREQAFRELARRVPEDLRIERSRLFTQWLLSVASLAGGPDAVRLSRKERKAADARLQEILTADDLMIANLEFLTYYATEVIPVVQPKKGARRRKLEQAWLGALARAENDESLSVDERLSVLIPVIDLYELHAGEDAPIDSALVERVRARVEWADATARDAYTRQAALSTAGYLLRRSGLKDEAKQLYLDEIERSESPYYFMSSLAGLAERDGDAEQAVTWMGRAYEAAEGRATRFQWGTSYLLGLMRLLPDDDARIRTESLRVFKELLAHDDAFAGRNHSRIQRLAKQFSEWNADNGREATVGSLRTALTPACNSLSDEAEQAGESLSARCMMFFEQLGAPAVAAKN